MDELVAAGYDDVAGVYLEATQPIEAPEAHLPVGGRLLTVGGAGEWEGVADFMGTPMFWSHHAPLENRRLLEAAGSGSSWTSSRPPTTSATRCYSVTVSAEPRSKV